MKNLIKLTILYDFDKDEVVIEQDSSFSNLPKIHQLDALGDAIYEIDKIYCAKLKEFHNGLIEGDSYYLTKTEE